MEQNTPYDSADMLMTLVDGYCENGLDPVYTDFQDYMYDFWPDLPWDYAGNLASCKYIIEKHSEVLDKVKAKFGYDLRKDIEAVIAEGGK